MSNKILIVENENNWQNVLRAMLPSSAYNLHITDNCEHAEGLVIQEDFDLVITNIDLIDTPETVNDRLGLRLLEFLKEEKLSVPRIVITGNPGGPVYSTFSHLDVDDVLIKSQFTASQLTDTVNKAIAFHKKHKGGSLNNLVKVKVFINHASEGKQLARKLFDELKKRTWLDPWLDEEKLLPGQDWVFEIDKALKESDAVLICMSSTSVKKIGYVQNEIHKAKELQKLRPQGDIFMIPILLEPCQVPESLKMYNWVDISQSGATSKIVQSLETLIK